MQIPPEESGLGKFASVWVVVASRDEDLHAFKNDPRWKPPHLGTRSSLWTDDYSNIIEHFILGAR